MLNNVIYIFCSLATANTPSKLEPSGLYRADGKCPDGVCDHGSLVEWEVLGVGQPLCGHLVTPIDRHLPEEVGGAAAHAETEKVKTYANMDQAYPFQPIAVRTWAQIPCSFSVALVGD